MTFESYKEMCKKHKIKNPYNTEDEYYRAYPPTEEVKRVVPKLVKTKQPTLGLNIINSKKIRIAKPDIPRRQYNKRPSDWKRKAKTNRVMVAPKITYKGMSVEEIRAHKNKLAREWRARVKPERTAYSELTDAQKEGYKAAKMKHYEANRDAILAKNKAKRANRTPEQKALNAENMRQYRASLTEEKLAEMNRRTRDARRLKRKREKDARNNTTIKA
jgi:hypothetical protein